MPCVNANINVNVVSLCLVKQTPISLSKLFVGNNYTGQEISNFFVPVMNMLLIYLFASMKLEKGHKNYLALILKLCYTMIFYEIG